MAPPRISSGARTPPDVPDDRATNQIAALTKRIAQHCLDGEVPGQQIGDDVVADTERARLDQAAEADEEAADGRPPHPVDRQALERILQGVEQLRQKS